MTMGRLELQVLWPKLQLQLQLKFHLLKERKRRPDSHADATGKESSGSAFHLESPYCWDWSREHYTALDAILET
jgi:hypothetical protein